MNLSSVDNKPCIDHLLDYRCYKHYKYMKEIEEYLSITSEEKNMKYT